MSTLMGYSMKEYFLTFGLILSLLSATGHTEIVLDSATHQVQSGSFGRYILVNGEKLVSAQRKVEEYAELSSAEPTIKYNFKFAYIGNWAVIGIPNSTSHWMFHNLAYWFLGYSGDQNFADKVIGIAVDESGSNRGYLVYGQNDQSRPEDSLYGQTQQGVDFIVNVPFDHVVLNQNSDREQLQSMLAEIGVNLPFKAPNIANSNSVTIEFHESLSTIPN